MKVRGTLQLAGGLLSAALLLLLGAGCASTGYEQANKAAVHIQDAANLIGTLPGQIDKTLASLNNMIERPQGDLRPQFKEFSANLAELESSAQDVADARADMVARSKAFFDKWNEELALIQNEDIKARSQNRKDEVSRKMDAVSESYGEATSAFKPFLSDLRDVRKFLSVDLTAGGIESIKKTVADVDKNAGPVKKAVARVAADFRALGLTLSSAAPPPPPQK